MAVTSIWRDIPGWEGRYQASALGHIRSMPKGGRPGVILRERYTMRVRSTVKDARVNLCRNGEMETVRVGALVARAWCPGYAPGMQVNHKDGNTLNNKASNLEWVTGAENNAHAIRAGLIPALPIVLARDGASVFYVSCAEASRALGHAKGYIYQRLHKGKWRAYDKDKNEYSIILITGGTKAA